MGLPATDPVDRPGRAGPPPWRVVAAVAVLAVLAAALVAVSPRSVEPVGAASVPLEAEASTVPTGGGDDELIGDVRASMAAWAEFASTGDLGRVSGWFVTDGPQHRQLTAEADTLAPLAAGDGYRFTLTGAEALDRGDDRAVVRGAVTVISPAGDEQIFRWDIEMRRTDTTARWRLWTVTTAP